MTDFEVGGRISFAGGRGEITKIEDRPGENADLLFVHTDGGELRKIPSTLPGIEKLQSIEDLVVEGAFDAPRRYELRHRATELDLAYQYDRFLTLTSNRIQIEPYQVKAAYEILNSYEHRYLIADEVGLGKTVEAAIVVEELIARDRADRVLIVTPAPLTVQWQEEMREKFNRNYVIYDRAYVESMRNAHPRENVWEIEDFVITSIDFAKQEDLLEALKRVEWDVTIFDEAHHLTCRRKDDRPDPTQRYRVADAVSPNTDALLLITATPHKGKSDQFYYLVSLLDPYRFESEYDITPDELDDLMIRRLKEDMHDADGTKMFPDKTIETLAVEFTRREREFYEEVTRYVREFYNMAKMQEKQAAGFAMVIYQKRLVSSIRAIEKSLKKRAKALEEGNLTEDPPADLKPLVSTYEEDPEMLTEKERERVEQFLESVAVDLDPRRLEIELNKVQDLVRKAESIRTDSKAEKLRDYVEGVLMGDPDEKILIFTEYTDTLAYLRDEVLSDLDVAQIYGDLDQATRRREVEKFRNKANVMLATDAAREGINLQFAHLMVNYDLPWNPIRIDQRMGRLHRYGQEEDVEIKNLFVKETRESDILELLLEKMEVIESELGVQSDVLGMVLEDFDVEQKIMESLAEGSTPDEVVQEIEEAVEERKEAFETVQTKFLIRDRFNPESVEDVLDFSQDAGITEEDIENLVRLFFEEHDGTIKGIRPGPTREGGDILQIEPPDVIVGGDVDRRYDRATFTREIAVEHDDVDFIALDHPLVQNIIEFSLDEERTGGLATVATAKESDGPGLLCNFRLAYVSGAGEAVTEKLVPIYVRADGSVTSDTPELTHRADSAGSDLNPSVVLPDIETLLDKAKEEAWVRIESLADKARQDRERVVEIKREHAERYFEREIERWEKRIKRYERKQREEGAEMGVSIGRARSEIEELDRERERELDELESEAQVIPEDPQLINTALVVSGTARENIPD